MSIAIFAKRRGIAQALLQRLCAHTGIDPFFEPDYGQADTVIRARDARAALIEATEDKCEDILYCLSLCSKLRKEIPCCRLLLLCPESNSVVKAVEARKDGIIEDFVFYDASIDYIVSKLLSM